jgi:CheY-like chemotaxis protein
VLTKILRREGYTVATVPDGASAAAFLRAVPETAVLLLEMLLPGQDGWDFLARRTRDPALARIPVIITSGLGVATPEWAESLGAYAAASAGPTGRQVAPPGEGGTPGAIGVDMHVAGLDARSGTVAEVQLVLSEVEPQSGREAE